jgi:hypothetical protein
MNAIFSLLFLFNGFFCDTDKQSECYRAADNQHASWSNVYSDSPGIEKTLFRLLKGEIINETREALEGVLHIPQFCRAKRGPMDSSYYRKLKLLR